MKRNFEKGMKVRIATREEIIEMDDKGIVTIHGEDEDVLEVQGENSSSLPIFIGEMGKVGTFKKIDSDGDAVIALDNIEEYYIPEELLTIVEDEDEKTEKEVEKSDKKLIRFENVDPYFKLSNEQIELLKILSEYGLLSEDYIFVDEIEIIEV